MGILLANKYLSMSIESLVVKSQKKTQKLRQDQTNAKKQNLRYPGRVLCIEKQTGLPNNLLIISDTANNRLVMINE